MLWLERVGIFARMQNGEKRQEAHAPPRLASMKSSGRRRAAVSAFGKKRYREVDLPPSLRGLKHLYRSFPVSSMLVFVGTEDYLRAGFSGFFVSPSRFRPTKNTSYAVRSTREALGSSALTVAR